MTKQNRQNFFFKGSALGNPTEFIVKNFLTKKTPGLGDFTSKFNQTFMEEIIPPNLLQKIQKKGTLPNSFMKSVITRYQNKTKYCKRKTTY